MPGVTPPQITQALLQEDLDLIAEGAAYTLQAKYWSKHGLERMYIQKNMAGGGAISLGYIELFHGDIESLLHLIPIDMDFYQNIGPVIQKKYRWHSPSPYIIQVQQEYYAAVESAAA